MNNSHDHLGGLYELQTSNLIMLTLFASPICTIGYARAENRAVRVEWNKVTQNVDPKAYGFDCPACFDLEWTRSPVLHKSIETIAAGEKPIVRRHGWGMVSQGSNECWLNKDGTWNAAKIKSALTPVLDAEFKAFRGRTDTPVGDFKHPPGPVFTQYDIQD